MSADRTISDAPNTPRAPDDTQADEAEDGPPQGLIARIMSLWQRPHAPGETRAASPHAGGALPRTRRDMIERVIAFAEKRVVDVMKPRADIVAVDIDTPLDELVRLFVDAGHSRMPIYRGALDDPVGMVHIKDVLRLVASPENARTAGAPEIDNASDHVLDRLRREILFVPPSMQITDLLLRMQTSRVHMALVIDEFGGTDGLLTIEDLVEEIVGDINDEHDVDDGHAVVPRPGGWDVDARAEIDDFAAISGFRLDHDDDEVDTLGGLVIAIAGKVPGRGEVVRHVGSGLDFEIMEADERKIRKMRVRRPTPADPLQDG